MENIINIVLDDSKDCIEILRDDSLRSDTVSPCTDLPGICFPGSNSEEVVHQKIDKMREGTEDLRDMTQVSSSSSNGFSEKSKRGAKKKMTTRRVGNIEDKSNKKTDSALVREAKKLKLSEEKAAKKTANEMNKIYKPAECMKYMNIEIHPVLLEAWYMGDVSREVSASGAKLVTSHALFDTGLVMWSRSVPQTLTTGDGQVKLTPSKQLCERALYVCPAEEAGERVRARALAAHVAQLRAAAARPLTLLVFGVKDYFKSSGRKTLNSSRKAMTEIDLEMALTDVLVSTGCDSVVVNTPNELALLIVQFTKAIAETPYKKAKRACDEEAEFYMKGDNKKCVAVDKDGNGLSRLWQQMIAILPKCSLESSRALCAKYKSPLALYEALQSSNSVGELADVGVARAAVPGSKARRIGPEFARRLHTLFTAEDGNVLLD